MTPTRGPIPSLHVMLDLGLPWAARWKSMVSVVPARLWGSCSRTVHSDCVPPDGVSFRHGKSIKKPLVQFRDLRCQLSKGEVGSSVCTYTLIKSSSLSSKKLTEEFFSTFPEIFTHLLGWSMGNWSPHYYEVWKHSFVFEVVGLVESTTFTKISGFDEKNLLFLKALGDVLAWQMLLCMTIISLYMWVVVL